MRRASTGIDVEELADVFADPGVDLLQRLDVMRIERVVEIEHPRVDVTEAAVRMSLCVDHL